MKVFAFMLLLSSFSVSAQARRWFYQPVNCYVDGQGARCQMTNFRFYTAYCEADVTAVTSFGYRIQRFFRGQLFSRQATFVNIFAINPYRDPIVNVQARGRCLY